MQVIEMFQVNNRKVLTLIAGRSVKKSRTRNVIAVLAIALTSILFTTIFTIGESMVESTQLSTMRQVGTKAHGGFKYMTRGEYETLAKDPEVKDVSYNRFVAFGENAAFNKSFVEIRYSEEKAAEWSFAMPTTGALPEERLGIATSTSVLDALGLPHELGVRVPLEFTANGKKYRETFTLCGFWEQDGAMFAGEAYVSREYADEVAPEWQDHPENFGEYSYESGCLNSTLWFSNAWDLEEQMRALKERCGFGPEVDEGTNWGYMTEKVDAGTVLTIAGLALLVMLSGYLIIYNIFYISVSNEIRFYGLLKTVGTTNRQLARIVRKQAFLLSLIGIPAGLLVGYGFAVVFMPRVASVNIWKEHYVVSANPVVFIGSALFSLLTVWVSCVKPCRFVKKIFPVEAVRYTERAAKSRRRRKRTRRVSPLSMAAGNLARTKKKTAAVVVSLFLSLVLLNGTVTFVRGFDIDKFLAHEIMADVCMTDASLYNAVSGGRVFNSITPQIRNEVCALPGITDAGSVYMQEYVHEPEGKAYETAKQIFEELRASGIVDEMFLEECAEALYEEQCMPSHLYGVEGLAAEKLEIFEGQPDMEKLKSGDYVIVSPLWENGEGHFYEVGDSVELDFGNGNKKTYEVLALGGIPSALGPRHGHNFQIYFTMDASEFIAQTGEASAMNLAFNVSDEERESVLSWVKDYCENINTNLDFRTRESYEQEFQGIQNMILLAGSMLALVLGLIGVLNFVNAIVTSIQVRRLELAALQSVGMTGKQLLQMLIFEGGCYMLLTAVFALGAGSALIYAFSRAVSGQISFFTYRFVIAPMLLCIPVCFVIAVAAPVVCYRQMCKQSVVERLRVEE